MKPIKIQTVIDQEIIKNWEMNLMNIRLDLDGNIYLAHWKYENEYWEETIANCQWRPVAIETDKEILIDIEIMPIERLTEGEDK